jgi:hypothetical protein
MRAIAPAQSHGERVRGVVRVARAKQHHPHHLLHLIFARPTVSDQRLLTSSGVY